MLTHRTFSQEEEAPKQLDLFQLPSSEEALIISGPLSLMLCIASIWATN